jgi:hypothetical protein
VGSPLVETYSCAAPLKVTPVMNMPHRRAVARDLHVRERLTGTVPGSFRVLSEAHTVDGDSVIDEYTVGKAYAHVQPTL